MPITIGKHEHALSTPNVHPGQFNNQRRSQRVLLSVLISVSGNNSIGKPFEEKTSTTIVNAHGALIQLSEEVRDGELLTVKNLKTEESLVCKIIDVDPGRDGMQEVGLEFLEPNPRFWRVSFPPPDWTQRSPEAKRFTPPAPLGPKPLSQPIPKK